MMSNDSHRQILHFEFSLGMLLDVSSDANDYFHPKAQLSAAYLLPLAYGHA